MALIVEDGSGRSDSESFASVADADAYWSLRGNPSDWTSANTAAKESALRAASDYVEARFAERWMGCRISTTQRMSWPRYGVYVDAVYVSSSAVPEQVRFATIELALRSLTETDGLMPDIAEPGSIAAESVSLGEISTSTTYIGAKSQFKKFSRPDALLRPLVSGGDFARLG